MNISFDMFINAFLMKISEFELLSLEIPDRTAIVDEYLKQAIADFRHVCQYDFVTTRNDETRQFDVEVEPEDVDELVGIISEGMVVQWLKPYVNKQELLENILNTRDFTTYSPAELLYRVRDTYEKARREYTNMIREYSYNHGDLTNLHI